MMQDDFLQTSMLIAVAEAFVMGTTGDMAWMSLCGNLIL